MSWRQSTGRGTDSHPAEAPADRTRWRKGLLGLGPIIVGACVVSAVLGGAAGYWANARGDRTSEDHEEAAPSEAKAVTWYCSMHPHITSPTKGKCSICFMDLIEMPEGLGEGAPRELKMSEAAAALAEIRTARVGRRYVTKRVRMVGKIDYDETRLADITAWVDGRLDRLYVDYTGITVRKGDHLVKMYSPELVVAQRELLQARQATSSLTSPRNRDLMTRTLEAAEEKLRLLGLLPEQIEEIKQRGTTTDHLTIFATAGGIVIQKHANEGIYVKTGAKIYTIADLSRVWVLLDAYESDLPWLRYGQEVEFSSESYPGEIFRGRITFINPVLDNRTRTVKIRVNVDNTQMRLKPGMFVRAVAKSRLAAGGRVLDRSLAGKWVSPMHPEVIKDGPGQCDICGMDLVRAEALGLVVATNDPRPLVIPATAPLITGKRAVVYVKLPDREEPTFEGREVMLGHRAGDHYLVRHGLAEGEEVVVAGNFKIDSELQLRAQPSMMSPETLVVQADQEEPADGEQDTIEVSDRFRAEVAPLVEAYLEAADALADDDLATLRRAVGEMVENTRAVDAELLNEEARAHWEKWARYFVFAGLETHDAADRPATRERFEQLSRAVVAFVATFGNPLNEPLHQVHCPMAFLNRGADWLQRGEEVRNPYFGPEMLECGEIRATFPVLGLLVVSDRFQRQFDSLLATYLEVQVALADDRLDDAKAAWKATQEAAKKVRANDLPPPAAEAWHAASQRLAGNLALDIDEADVGEVRQAFEPLAATVLGLVDRFGYQGKTPLYEAYCPMAFENRGAQWLQAGDTVDNPYFGHMMKRCGEIRRKCARGIESPSAEERPVGKEQP